MPVVGRIFIVTPKFIKVCNKIVLIKPINVIFLNLSLLFCEMENTLNAKIKKIKIIIIIATIPNSSAITAKT